MREWFVAWLRRSKRMRPLPSRTRRARGDILVAGSAKPSSAISSEREKARRSVETSMLTHHGLGLNAQSLSMTPQQFSASTSGSFATPADEEATDHSI